MSRRPNPARLPIPPNAGQEWTAQQDLNLRRLFTLKHSIEVIAFTLGRTQVGVAGRLQTLGLMERGEFVIDANAGTAPASGVDLVISTAAAMDAQAAQVVPTLSPGPWTIEPEYISAEHQGTTGNWLIFDASHRWIATVMSGEANARLMCEAHNLLTTLQSYEQAWAAQVDSDDDIDGGDAVEFIGGWLNDDVRPAIAKAMTAGSPTAEPSQLAKLTAFGQSIARMETAAEFDERTDDGMSGDDACATLSSLIEEARALLGAQS